MFRYDLFFPHHDGQRRICLSASSQVIPSSTSSIGSGPCDWYLSWKESLSVIRWGDCTIVYVIRDTFFLYQLLHHNCYVVDSCLYRSVVCLTNRKSFRCYLSSSYLAQLDSCVNRYR